MRRHCTIAHSFLWFTRNTKSRRLWYTTVAWPPPSHVQSRDCIHYINLHSTTIVLYALAREATELAHVTTCCCIALNKGCTSQTSHGHIKIWISTWAHRNRGCCYSTCCTEYFDGLQQSIRQKQTVGTARCTQPAMVWNSIHMIDEFFVSVIKKHLGYSDIKTIVFDCTEHVRIYSMPMLLIYTKKTNGFYHEQKR